MKHVWFFAGLAPAFAGHRVTVVAGRLWEFNMAHSQEHSLPVLNPVTDYEKIKRVGEGTYGVVCTVDAFLHTHFLSDLLSGNPYRTDNADKARNRKTGEIVALKKLRMDRERDGKGPAE